MKSHLLIALILASTSVVTATGSAFADDYLGSYIARLSRNDHRASDGYPLSSAAQIVRQDRANVHRFGVIDAEDEGDPWFGSNNSRSRLESMLKRRGAIDSRVQRLIRYGEPLVEVHVYRSGVVVEVIGR